MLTLSLMLTVMLGPATAAVYLWYCRTKVPAQAAFGRTLAATASVAVLAATAAALAWFQTPPPPSRDEEAVGLATAYLGALNRAQGHLDAARALETRAASRQKMADAARSVPEVASALQQEAQTLLEEMRAELGAYQTSKAMTIEVMAKARDRFSAAEFDRALARYGRPGVTTRPKTATIRPSDERLPLEPPTKD